MATAACGLACELEVGGLVPLSTVDDPGRLAAVVFCQGCPWRCPYCHNPALLPKRSAAAIPWRRVEDLLRRRRGLLESVVFSGGEPTLQPQLHRAVRRARSLGYRVGLHTAGIFPDRLASVLEDVDWVGLDVKAPFDLYPRITRGARDGRRVAQSLEQVLEAASSQSSRRLEYEVRTTFHPQLISEADLCRLAEDLADRGVRRYALQRFRPEGCADRALRHRSAEVSDATTKRLASLFDGFVLR